MPVKRGALKPASKTKDVAAREPAQPKKRGPAKFRDPDNLIKINVELPRALHKRLKLHVVDQEISIQDYVRGLIEASLKV